MKLVVKCKHVCVGAKGVTVGEPTFELSYKPSEMKAMVKAQPKLIAAIKRAVVKVAPVLAKIFTEQTEQGFQHRRTWENDYQSRKHTHAKFE